MIRPDQLFNAPIPGQSLTDDPNARKPWEMPPQYATSGKALDHLFKTVTNKKFMQAFHKLIKEDKKFYVDTIACQMLQEGFLHGLWTVDLMLTLIEPLIITLVWLASTMDLSVSFSTDNGSEDRTGFEDIFGELVGFDAASEQAQAESEGTDVTAEGQAEAQPAQTPEPRAAQIPQAAPQSPLVGGM